MIITVRLILFVSFMLCLAQTKRISRLADHGWASAVRTACKELAAGFVVVAALTYVVAVDDHSRVMSQLQNRDKVIQQLSAQRGDGKQQNVIDGRGIALARGLMCDEQISGTIRGCEKSEATVEVVTRRGTTIRWIDARSIGPVLGTGTESGSGRRSIGISPGRVPVCGGGATALQSLTKRTVRNF